MEYIFRWDEEKAEANRRKHGILFEEAESVFADEFYVTYSDEKHSDEEERFLTFGNSMRSRLLVVIHTQQEIDPNLTLVRIISCRKVTRKERQNYEG